MHGPCRATVHVMAGSHIGPWPIKNIEMWLDHMVPQVFTSNLKLLSVELCMISNPTVVPYSGPQVLISGFSHSSR